MVHMEREWGNAGIAAPPHFWAHLGGDTAPWSNDILTLFTPLIG